VTRACMDPILTAFLACWNYEELWHGENLGKLLNLYGIQFDTQDRIARVRANLGVQNSLSILTTMAGSWLSKDFSAIYLTIGAINELTTLTGYGAVIRKSKHPVLADLLSRIVKDERRHFASYFNSAKEWLTDNRAAQRIDRWALDRVWVPVGKGVKKQAACDALARCGVCVTQVGPTTPCRMPSSSSGMVLLASTLPAARCAVGSSPPCATARSPWCAAVLAASERSSSCRPILPPRPQVRKSRRRPR